MKVFVLIPVFNRLHHTQKVVEALRIQVLQGELHVVVINDGSTDGTTAWLDAQPDVVQLRGDGTLWWGGAIQRGLEWVLAQAAPDGDFVLFLNNDTWFAANYVQTLVDVSRATGAAVGSVIHEDGRDPALVSIGARMNVNRMAVWDVLADLSPDEVRHPKNLYRVDALSGRGTLYPVTCFRTSGVMRPTWLPHYLADYEIAMRFARAGTPLVVSTDAVVHSPPVYGNDISRMGLWDRMFSTRSSSNVVRRLAFYLMVGSPLQRMTAPLRLLFWGCAHTLVRITRSVRA